MDGRSRPFSFKILSFPPGLVVEEDEHGKDLKSADHHSEGQDDLGKITVSCE